MKPPIEAPMWLIQEWRSGKVRHITVTHIPSGMKREQTFDRRKRGAMNWQRWARVDIVRELAEADNVSRARLRASNERAKEE